VDALTACEHRLETPPESVDGWALVPGDLDQLLRVDWEADAGTPFDLARAVGLSFAFNGLQDARTVASSGWMTSN